MYHLTKVLKVHRKMIYLQSHNTTKLELIFSMKMVSVFERKKYKGTIPYPKKDTVIWFIWGHIISNFFQPTSI